MLALAAVWLLLTRASLALGGRLRAGAFEEDYAWFPSLWTGLLALSSAALLTACFLPLSPWVAAALLVPPILIWRKPPAPPRYFWLVLAAMAFVSSGPERLYDTALYHRPLIEWMAHEGLVPGLGILHFRLGFSSSWLVWPAAFDHGPWFARMGSAATGLGLASVVTHWIQRAAAPRTLASRFFLFGAPPLCAYLLMASMLVSPSPNLGAALAVFVVLWMLLVPGAERMALTAAGGAAAVKLSAAVVLPVCLWRNRKGAALALALAAPLAIANFRTTGCPLFPSGAGCAESTSSAGRNVALRIEHETQNWARYAGPYPAGARFASLDWFPRWWSFPEKRAELLVALFSLLWLALRRQWDACALGAAAGFAYVFVLAPDFRFGAGFLAALPARALAASPLPLPSLPPRPMAALALATLLIGGYAGERMAERVTFDARLRWQWDRLWRPAVSWSPESPGQMLRGGFLIRTPGSGGDRCGAVPRPCAPDYGPLPGIRLCDPARGLRGGFCRPR